MKRQKVGFAILGALLGLACTEGSEAAAEGAPRTEASPAARAAMPAAEAPTAPGTSGAAAEAPAASDETTARTPVTEPAVEPSTPAERAPEAPKPARPVELGGGGKATCGGDEDKPPCPLEKWMDDNTTPAVENGDTKALALALHKIEFMAPDPKWDEGPNGWAKISREGALAAEKGDMKAAKASCKTCHKAWRDKYKADHRTKPVPTLPKDADKGRKDLK